MNRRSFLGRVAALLVTPLIPILPKKPSPSFHELNAVTLKVIRPLWMRRTLQPSPFASYIINRGKETSFDGGEDIISPFLIKTNSDTDNVELKPYAHN